MSEVNYHDLVISFRKAIEYAVSYQMFPSDDRMSRFPKGCCDDACDLLGMYLKMNGIKTRQILGTFRDDNLEHIQNHAWLLMDNGIIIDITGDQFSDRKELLNYNTKTFVSTEDSFHKLFRERKTVENIDFQSSTVDGTKRLKKDYAIIMKCLNND